MIILAIILATIGLMLLPLERLYIAMQRKKNNTRFADPIFVQKIEIAVIIVSVCLFGSALYILHGMM